MAVSFNNQHAFLPNVACAAEIRRDAETLGGCQVPHVSAAKRFPSETQWREY